MRGAFSAFLGLSTLALAVSLLTGRTQPAYANCFSDPPRGVAAGHKSNVASGSAKLCSTNWHCAVDESEADRCYVRDADGTFVRDAGGKKVRKSWIFDAKLNDYRPRSSGDDVQSAEACRQKSGAAFGAGDRVTFACNSDPHAAPSAERVYRLDDSKDPSSPLYGGPPRL